MRNQKPVLFLLLCGVLLPGLGLVVVVPCASAAPDQPPVRYIINLANPAAHLVRVTLHLPPGAAERELQLPVWNALYQVRDFSQYVNWVRASDSKGQPLTVRKLDKSRWQVSGMEAGGEIEYEIFANDAGPFGAQLSPTHAFFNLAEILMYEVDLRATPVIVSVNGMPAGWRIAVALPGTAR